MRDGERWLFGDAMEWDAAESLFLKAAKLERVQAKEGSPGLEVNPSRIMAARCGVMKASPPGDQWNGVYVMKTK